MRNHVLRDTNCVQNWWFLSGKISQFHAIPDLFTASLHNSPEGQPSAPTFCLSFALGSGILSSRHLLRFYKIPSTRFPFKQDHFELQKHEVSFHLLFTTSYPGYKFRYCPFSAKTQPWSQTVSGLLLTLKPMPLIHCCGKLPAANWDQDDQDISRPSSEIIQLVLNANKLPRSLHIQQHQQQATNSNCSNCFLDWALIVWLLIIVELDCRWDSKISVFLCTFSIWESRSCSPSPGDVLRFGQFQSFNLHLRRNDLLEPSISRKTWQVALPRKGTYDFEGRGRRLLQFSHLFGYLTHATNFDLMSRSHRLSQYLGLRALCNHNVLHASFLYLYYLKLVPWFQLNTSVSSISLLCSQASEIVPWDGTGIERPQLQQYHPDSSEWKILWQHSQVLCKLLTVAAPVVCVLRYYRL